MSSSVWLSPISSEIVSSSGVIFEDLCAVSGQVVWTECRPLSKGKYALAACSSSNDAKTLLDNLSIKSRVHEYGGGSISGYDTSLYFVNDTEKAICRLDIQTGTYQILYKNSNIRFSEICVHPSLRGAYFVGEDISDPAKVLNGVYFLDFMHSTIKAIHSAHDFYSSLKISKDGTNLAFVCWDFPYMQWDRSSVYLLRIKDDFTLEADLKIAGTGNESAFQPEFSRDGRLYFITDKLGYWNLYRYDKGQISLVYECHGDIGQPQWKLGRNFFLEVFYKNESGIICSLTENAADRLIFINAVSGLVKDFDLPFTSITHLTFLDENTICFFAASPTQPKSIVLFNLKTESYDILKSSYQNLFSDEWISSPQQVSFPSGNKSELAHAFYYPPKNPQYKDVDPCAMIIRSHGGPTGHNPPVYNPEIQFWTSRGFAYLDVNYSGSSGFGRKYRSRLNGKWGDLDVKDCVLAANYILNKGLVRSGKVFIKGSSSGGLTALMAAIESPVFTACTSYYGVVDLELLVHDTHKFELHYLDVLIGKYPLDKNLYIQRSPIHNVHKIMRPVLLFQGRDDRVVLPSQAENIFLKLKEKQIRAELILFDGEGHGFRKKETIEFCLEKELEFYSSFLT
ncbi:MAG: S9 family peptidase [Chlamydiae bacterium]|nr:S9 family peptidase [Chlamydiota bacterium]